jgi:hypothetical protein
VVAKVRERTWSLCRGDTPALNVFADLDQESNEVVVAFKKRKRRERKGRAKKPKVEGQP